MGVSKWPNHQKRYLLENYILNMKSLHRIYCGNRNLGSKNKCGNENVNAINAQVLDAMAEIMQEEFMYLNDYEIRNKEDWLEEMQSHFDTKESDLSVGRRILCETKDCYAAERIANIDGVKSGTTVMAFVKESKIHRLLLQRVPIE